MPSDEALIQQAEEWKATGNAAFGRGELKEAISAYSQGIVASDRLSSPPPALLKVTLLSNRAMCSLKILNLPSCIDDCTTALKLDPADAKLRNKLLYRRAKARFLLANTPAAAEQQQQQQSKTTSDMLQDAAKDLLQLLQTDANNKEANQLLQTIRAQHKTTQTATTPVSKTLDALRGDDTKDVPHHIKVLLGLMEDDPKNASMELARLQGIPLLLEIAKQNAASNNSNNKTGILALQCLSRAGGHPAFVQQYLKDYQTNLLEFLTSLQDGSDSLLLSSELVVSVLGVYLRILLHADRDDPTQDITGTTLIDYATLVKVCNHAVQHHPRDKLVLRAVLDVLSTWTAGTERLATIRASLQGTRDPTIPPPKTQAEIRAMTPQELAAYKRRELDTKNRDLAWAFERSMLFFRDGLPTLLHAACICDDHIVRREITVTLSRMLAHMDQEDESGDRIKQVVQPFLANDKRENEELTIEEVYNEDEEEAKQAALEEENVVPLETKMQRALLTAALLLSKKEVGAWALGSGWKDSDMELPDLINSENPRAMCLASEVVSGAAAVESARQVVVGLMNAGLMEKLMKSDDRDIRSGAASAVAKIGLSDKTTDEAERIGLLEAACGLLEDKAEDETPSKDDKKLHHFTSFAGSSVERAIEMLTYLVPNTEVKEELVAGFQAPGASQTALERLVALTDIESAGESLSGFGLATIFQHLAVTNLQLRKEAFEGKEITMEAYDEMQRMGKTEEEKELMDAEKDTDTKELCSERIQKLASANVPRALVSLTEGASEHTLEQCVTAMSRMAGEQSVRGVMIQQGVLSACIKIDKNEGPTDTDTMKKVIRLARHCIAKLLVTTNPSLLTSAQRLGSIRPMIFLVRDINATDLQHFEALMSLTNIASSGEDAQNRIVTERGIGTFHFAMFDDHEMVRRAATEAMCNLVPHKAMMEHLCQDEHLKLWLSFASDYEENYECARAASGCLAMATQDVAVALELVEIEKFQEQTSSMLESGRLEIMYRAMAMLFNLIAHGGPTKEKVESSGLVAFCKAYVDSYHDNTATHDLDFSPEEKALLPVTVDIAKEIIASSDST